MSEHFLPASFEPDGSCTGVADQGPLAHRDAIAHTELFARKLWTVRCGVWCLVGNGRTAEPPIWGHAGIGANRQRMAAEVSAAASRGLVHQFGVLLPGDGPDGLVNVGLGREFRSRSRPDTLPPTTRSRSRRLRAL